MSLVQALVAGAIAPSFADLSAAHKARSNAPRGPRNGIYADTEHRRRMRALLDGAGLANAQVKLGFLKLAGELRYMLCVPCPGCDTTAKYVTVVDVELSEQRERTVYRRVNLDTIAAAQVEFRAAPAAFN